ncbi:MAG: hypothetical protein QNJ40_12770 [Xanthomonadales bacterium]|nr:hypothetical protein [Xanthomonadales bacterium]
MRLLGAFWAVIGFSLLLIVAIHRLGEMALEGLADSLNWMHWALLIANVAFMAYSEGYRGFQLKFSPRFALRVAHVHRQGTLVECLLAPFYAMGFFSAPRRVIITTYALTLMIIGFVITFRYIPQPWRGVLDAGVVVGLLWGLLVSWREVVRHWPNHRLSEESS